MRPYTKLVAYLPHLFNATGANIAQSKGKLTEIKGLNLFHNSIRQYMSQHNTVLFVFSIEFNENWFKGRRAI